MGGVGAGGICILKEHQVAQLEVGDLVAAGELLRRGTLDGVAQLLEHVLGKAGAIKAAGGGAAPDVGGTQQGIGKVHNLLAHGDHRLYRSALAHIGLGVPRRGLGERQQIRADITGLTFILHLVPAAVEADDVGRLTGGEGGQEIAVGAGGAAEVDRGVFHHAVAQVNVLPLLEGDVLGGHVADLEVVVHQIPAVHLADDDHVVAIGGVGQNLSVGVGLGAQAQSVGFHNADAGFQFNGGSAHCHGRNDGHDQKRREKPCHETFHFAVPPCLPLLMISRSEPAPAIHSQHPTPCKSRPFHSF